MVGLRGLEMRMADSVRLRPVVLSLFFRFCHFVLPTGVFWDGHRTAKSLHHQL